MLNDIEMNEIISNSINDSYHINPVVDIRDSLGEQVTVDLAKLWPGTDIFVDGRLFSKSDADRWYYSIGLSAPIDLTDREVANIIQQLGDKAQLGSTL